jgi:hypothetical protein
MRQGLIIESNGRDISIANGPLLVRLPLRDGGYAQEFQALDSKGAYRPVLSSIHKDLIPFSEHRACASPMIAGTREHLFAVCRESLRMVFSSVSATTNQLAAGSDTMSRTRAEFGSARTLLADDRLAELSRASGG